MSSTRKIGFLPGVLVVLAVLIVGLIAGIYIFLPYYLESKFLPKLIAETGISEYALEIRRIGFSGADLGKVRIGKETNPALHIRSVQFDYSPGELYRKTIDRVQISGVEVHARLEEGKFTLNGIELQKVLSNLQSGHQAEPSGGQGSLPVRINRMEIRNAAAIWKINDQYYRIPFEIDLIPENPDHTLWEVDSRLFPRGQTIAVKSIIDLTRRQIRLSAAVKTLDFGRFSDVIQLFGGLSASGRLDLTAFADLQMEPFEITSFESELKLEAWQLKTGRLHILNLDSKPLHTTLAGHYNADGNWQLRVNKSRDRKTLPHPIRFQMNQTEMVSKIPQIEISGRAGADRMTAVYSITVSDVRMDSGTETIELPNTVLKGTAKFSGQNRAFSELEMELQTPGINLRSAAGKITVKEASLSGTIKKTAGGGRKI